MVITRNRRHQAQANVGMITSDCRQRCLQGFNQSLKGRRCNDLALNNYDLFWVHLAQSLKILPLALWRLNVITHSAEHWRCVISNLNQFRFRIKYMILKEPE